MNERPAQPYSATSDHRLMENAQGDLERITLVQTGVGIGKPKQCQCPACEVTPHASDCAVHNDPAYPKGSCDCGAQQQKPWVSLTDEQKLALCKQFPDHLTVNAINSIEAKLKEKNT